MNTFVPSSDQHTSKTGPPIVFMDFGTVFPVCSTSQQRTLLSQLPAIRKFCCTVAGLNSKADTESSGGATTSKSFIRFVLVLPKLDWPNMLTRGFNNIFFMFTNLYFFFFNFISRFFEYIFCTNFWQNSLLIKRKSH
uniref:Uncharacterized protein n=1 Tax=Glossina palpalis gambiensis TaxID=67801 RepID=A0A1B0BDW2_9MUSC